MAILVGTSAAEEILGTDSQDRITGLGGDDQLRGAGAGDLVFGVSGLNHMFGEAGNDVLVGGVDGGDGLDPDAIGKEYDPPLEETEQLYGGIGNDWIDGGAGEDSIFGEDGDDYLQSGPGHDYIVGGGGSDLIYGDAGLDQMYGGSGNDFIIDLLNAPNADHGEGLNGEAGDDLLIGSASWNVLTGGTGADVIMGGGQNDVMTGGDAIYDTSGGGVVLVGGTLDGSVDRFVFNEGDGHDSIYGFETGAGGDLLDLSRLTAFSSRDDLYIAASNGNVVVGLGDGSSVLLVGVSDPNLVTADNFIFRSPATDNPLVTLLADYSAATAGVVAGLEAGQLFRGRTDGVVPFGALDMRGSAFADVLAGDDNANRIEGGAGDDILEGRAGDDWLTGGAGADILSGGEGMDVASYAGGSAVTVDLSTGFASDGDILIGIEAVLGSSFDDVLVGSSDSDFLSGGDGDDRLGGGGGGDSLFGGNGVDTADYGESSAGVTISLLTGNTVGGDAAGDRFFSIENLTGSAYADFLKGDGLANRLEGGSGDDKLEGGAGNDVLVGGLGADLLIGGPGADVLNGGSGTDTADYTRSTAGVSVSLSTGSGTGGDAAGDQLTEIENLTGSNFDDVLQGDGDANRLQGMSGDDVLRGGAGADVLIGGAGTDTADYSGSPTGVTVSLLTGNTVGGDAAGDTFWSIENLSGSGAADFLKGNNQTNRLAGGNGDDRLDGVGGDDTLSGGMGGDILNGGDGIDTADYSNSAAGVTVSLLTGNAIGGEAAGDLFSSIENLMGSAFSDFLKGDSGANALRGGAGDDRLEGYGGNDYLVGGIGNDRFVFGSNTGVDVIWDFMAGAGTDDVIDFSRNPSASTFEFVLAHATQVGSDTLIDLGGGDQILLHDVTRSALHQDDFSF